MVSYGFSFALPTFAYIEVPKGFQHKVTPLLWPVMSPSTDPDTCNTEYINTLIVPEVKYIMLKLLDPALPHMINDLRSSIQNDTRHIWVPRMNDWNTFMIKELWKDSYSSIVQMKSKN